MVIFFKRGQTESLSFLIGIFLTIVFVTIAVYFLSLFWIEPDCFSLLQRGIKGAIDNLGENVEFECGFEKPIAVFDNKGQYAFKLFSKDWGYNFIILKPEVDVCNGKSCICECGGLDDDGLFGSFSVFKCRSAKCVGFDQTILSSCLVGDIDKKSTEFISCPFSLGGSFFGRGGPSVSNRYSVPNLKYFLLQLVKRHAQKEILGAFNPTLNEFENNLDEFPVGITYYPSINVVNLWKGVKPNLNLEALESVTKVLKENLESAKVSSVSVNERNMLNRLSIHSVGILDNKLLRIRSAPVFDIQKDGLGLVLFVSFFWQGQLVYRGIILNKDETVSSCFNGVYYPNLLVTLWDIYGSDNLGIYPLKESLFSGDLEIIDEVDSLQKSDDYWKGRIAFSESMRLTLDDKLELKNSLASDEVYFRKDPNNPDKLCLYEKGFNVAEKDITENA